MRRDGTSVRRRVGILVSGAAGGLALAATAWACTEPLQGPFVVTGGAGTASPTDDVPAGARGTLARAQGYLVQDEIQNFGTCDLLDGLAVDSTDCDVSLYWMEATDPLMNTVGPLTHVPHPCHHDQTFNGVLGSYTTRGTHITTVAGAADGTTGEFSFTFGLPNPSGTDDKLIWFCATGAGMNSNASMSNSLAPFLLT